MIRTVYHGSDHMIRQPKYGAGKPYNDYGPGFYCTEDPDMAKEWGVSRNRNGFANCYTLDCTGLDILDLNSPGFNTLNWLALLLENREFDAPSPLAYQAKDYIMNTFRIDYKSADCIIGYRADDSYFSFAQDFINGTISYRQLSNAMHLGKLGQQFVLKSRKAFGRITFTGYETADSTEWYARKMNRDLSARRQYFDTERFSIQKDDIFITQILSGEIQNDDPRLR